MPLEEAVFKPLLTLHPSPCRYQVPAVIGTDITEIDAAKDSADQRTVRLGALLVLEMLAGFQLRN